MFASHYVVNIILYYHLQCNVSLLIKILFNCLVELKDGEKKEVGGNELCSPPQTDICITKTQAGRPKER